MAKAKESKTHFQQVPLEMVKKLADVDIADDETSGAGAAVEPPAKKRAGFSARGPARGKALNSPLPNGATADRKGANLARDGVLP